VLALVHLKVHYISTKRSLSKTNLQAVIIELRGELVVALRDSFAGSGARLAKHRWQIVLSPVNLNLVQGLSAIVGINLRVNNSLRLLQFVEEKSICGREVSLFESILCRSVSKEQVLLSAALLDLLHMVGVVFVFFLSLRYQTNQPS